MPINLHHIFLIWLWVTIFGVIWIPVVWLLLSIFTPRLLLEKYFKEPHFTLSETYMMREFPGFLIRTGIFGWLLIFPSVDKKRNIKNIKKYMPSWYAIGLRVYIIGTMTTFAIFLGMMAGVSLLPERYGPDTVLFTIPWL